MQSVRVSDLKQRLSEISDLARREPVSITEPGRVPLILLSATDYDRLRRLEERATRALATGDLPDETVAAMQSADLSHLPED